MTSELLEVNKGVVNTFDGAAHEVEGGAYLSPEAYLRMNAELEQLRKRREAEASSTVPMLVVGAALLGLAAGYFLGRRGDEEED
jgi:hypothetical protein